MSCTYMYMYIPLQKVCTSVSGKRKQLVNVNFVDRLLWTKRCQLQIDHLLCFKILETSTASTIYNMWMRVYWNSKLKFNNFVLHVFVKLRFMSSILYFEKQYLTHRFEINFTKWSYLCMNIYFFLFLRLSAIYLFESLYVRKWNLHLQYYKIYSCLPSWIFLIHTPIHIAFLSNSMYFKQLKDKDCKDRGISLKPFTIMSFKDI